MFYDLNVVWPIPFKTIKSTGGGGGKKSKETKNNNNVKEETKEILTGRQKDDLRTMVMDAAELGFHVMAFNFIVRSKFDGNQHRYPYATSFAADEETNPSGIQVPFPELDVRNKKGKQTINSEPLIHQLSRMTLILDEDSMGKHGHGLTNMNQTTLMEYDLLSAQPFNDQSFSTLCLSLTELKPFSIDIISLDFSSHSRSPFFMKRSLVNAALQNGAVFEICYSKAVSNTSGNNNANEDLTKARRNIISCARDLIRMANGKGIILSSGAADLMGLRGPYDVINFASVIGMNPTAAKDAISSTCRSLILRAQTRKTFRGVVGDVQVVLPSKKIDPSNSNLDEEENHVAVKRKANEEHSENVSTSSKKSKIKK